MQEVYVIYSFLQFRVTGDIPVPWKSHLYLSSSGVGEKNPTNQTEILLMILSDVPEHIWLRTVLFLGYVDAEDTHLQLLKHTLSLRGLWHRILFIQLHMNYSTFHIRILHFFQPTRPNKMHQIQPDIMLISTGVSCRQQCSQQLLENRACLLYFFFF